MTHLLGDAHAEHGIITGVHRSHGPNCCFTALRRERSFHGLRCSILSWLALPTGMLPQQLQTHFAILLSVQ